MNYLIGTGFYCDAKNRKEKLRFADIWMRRNTVGMNARDVVMVNNSPFAVRSLFRQIRIYNNLGHMGDYIDKKDPTIIFPHPRLLGWSMSWIIPALIAYSELKHFVYVEQDCLLFGDCVNALLKEADNRKLNVAFGHSDRTVAACENSLFYIRHEFIPEFVSRYMAFVVGDAVLTVEQKFMRLAAADDRIAQFSLGVGRMRPLTFDSPAWYAQQFSETEMMELKCRRLI